MVGKYIVIPCSVGVLFQVCDVIFLTVVVMIEVLVVIEGGDCTVLLE